MFPENRLCRFLFSWKKQFLKYVSRHAFTHTLSLLGKKTKDFGDPSQTAAGTIFRNFNYLFSGQVKDRQKKKQSTKGIRVDAEGDASLEDLTNAGAQGTGPEPSPDPEKAKSSNKKVLKFFVTCLCILCLVLVLFVQSNHSLLIATC